MIIDREKLTQIIEEWLINSTFGEVRYSFPSDNPLRHTETNRIIIPIDGKLWMDIWDGSKKQTVLGKRGDIFYCVPNGFSESLYREHFSSLSIVFFPDFIRFVYYIYDETKTAPLADPDIYYHSSKPLFMPGKHLLMALNELAEFPQSERKGDTDLTKALMEFALSTLKTDIPVVHGKAFSTWQRIVGYINENCGNPISRASVAEHFQLSACYLSVICRKYTGKSFNNYLAELRLQRAAMLLTESNLILDEIADRCGFRYTSYFIRVFKQFYGTSPSKYRSGNLP
jgi:AraC-like DNA-binding protein